MKQRLIQLGARYVSKAGIAIAALAYGTVQPETAEQILANSEILVGALMAIIGIAADLLLHKVGAGGIFKPAGG